MFVRKIICLLLAADVVLSFGLPRKLHNRFNAMKKKMNKLMHGKQGNELFLDITELEYPRANETLRRAYREQWKEYYECLNQRLKDAGPEKTTYPIALLALQGTSITQSRLKCKLCISPAEMHTSEAIEWFFNSTTNSTYSNVPVETSEHILVTPDERDLSLYNIQMDEAGIYWCQLEDTVSAPYFLHVANEEIEKTRAVRPETAPKAENHSLPAEDLEEYGLRVFSAWSPWSPCSTCEKVGQKIRYGYCTISLIENNAHRINGNETAPIINKGRQKRSIIYRRRSRQIEDEETTIVSSETTKESTLSDENDDEEDEKSEDKSSEELREIARNLLPIFRNKLPCRSPYTPRDIQKIGKISSRRTEIMTGFCKIKCQENVIFEIRDKSGNVLESANNSAGIYSMSQGIPEPRPSVERVTIYRRHDKKAELQCPGNLNSDVPVIWQIGTKLVAPPALKRESEGRITVDSRQQIVLEKLRFADANIYSCWQRGELAGTIRLEVTNEVELKVDHRVFMIGAIVIISVFLTVFWRAFKGRKRFTMH